MDNFLDQLKFALEVARDSVRFETGGHVLLVVAAGAAVLILLWIFLFRKKGD